MEWGSHVGLENESLELGKGNSASDSREGSRRHMTCSYYWKHVTRLVNHMCSFDVHISYSCSLILHFSLTFPKPLWQWSLELAMTSQRLPRWINYFLAMAPVEMCLLVQRDEGQGCHAVFGFLWLSQNTATKSGLGRKAFTTADSSQAH